MRGKQLWSVYKALVNTHYGLSAIKDLYFKKRQRLWELILIIVALSLTAVMVVAASISVTHNIFSMGETLGEPEIVLSLSVVAAGLGTFVFSFGLVLSAFYFSDDIKTLIPLPLTALEVLTAKFATIFTSQYLILAVFIIPIWVFYGIKLDAHVFYYLKALIGFVFLPILPLVLATLVAIVLMRIVNISKRKDLFTVIGGVVVIVLFVGGQIYFQMQATNNPELFLEQLLMQTTSFVQIIGRLFPPSIWLTHGLTQPGISGLLYLVFFIGLTIVSFLVLLALAQKVFYKSVLMGMESGKASRRKSSFISYSSRPKVFSLALSDCKMFLRDPSYVLNGLIGYVLLPVLFVFQAITLGESLDVISQTFISKVDPTLIVVVVALYFSVIGVMSSIPATPFSREGKYLWNLRSLPVSAKEAMLAKLISAQIINFIGSSLGVIALAVVLNLSALPIIIGCIWGLVFSSGTSSLWVFLDLLRPMLNWTNPTKAIKSNINVIFSSIGTVGIILLVITRIMVHYSAGTFNQMVFEFAGFTVVIAILGYFLWNKFGEKAYKAIVQ